MVVGLSMYMYVTVVLLCIRLCSSLSPYTGLPLYNPVYISDVYSPVYVSHWFSLYTKVTKLTLHAYWSARPFRLVLRQLKAVARWLGLLSNG